MKKPIFNHSNLRNSRYRRSLLALVLGVVLSSCGRSAEKIEALPASRVASEDGSTSARIVDFAGYPFGAGWVLEITENDDRWATDLVDRAIKAYATGQVESELRYLRKVMEALNVVQMRIEGEYTDYRQPLFIKSERRTELAQRLERAGIDTMPARHTPWHYKDGLVQGLINVLENVETEGKRGGGDQKGGQKQSCSARQMLSSSRD